ncbi:restriction endonuclease subunit S [Clostridium bornimense]|uniref:restriction endonuclease subunit S n=1 Tax=Clostridium bornimense TaxID=1216932 RepID=UPI001C1152D0|nr:restriction endonuclease subunit S [Clostridium bornimense]MBU5315507.1 restriction endonuclease subunit S [Clostridium bornimense]
MWQEEFKLYKLKDVTKLKNGYAFKSNQFTENEVPIIRINNLQNNKVIIDKKICYPNEFLENNKQYEVKMGDILISMSGSIGKISRYSYTEASLLNQRVGKFEITEVNKLDREYLFYFLRSDEFQRAVIKDANGCVVSNISAKNISNCSIPVPSLEAQKKIVKVLKKAEDVVEKRKQAINLLDELVKSKFIEMFGDPVTNPKGWEKKKLNELGELSRGKSKHRPRNAPELLGGPYPLVQTGDIANAGIYLKEYTQTYSELGLKQSKMWDKGTLCITIAANIAKTSILTFDACFPDSVVAFIPNDKTNNMFIQFWMFFLQKILEDSAPESAQKNINLKILSEQNVIVPPIELQNQFADFVNQVDKLKFEMEESLKELENNFNSLMQRAFKGKLFN